MSKLDDGWTTPKTGKSYEVGYPKGIDPSMFTAGQRIKLKRSRRLSWYRISKWIEIKWKFRSWKNNNWTELPSVTFSVPPGNYKATATIRYDKGNVGTTVVIVPKDTK